METLEIIRGKNLSDFSEKDLFLPKFFLSSPLSRDSGGSGGKHIEATALGFLSGAGERTLPADLQASPCVIIPTEGARKHKGVAEKLRPNPKSLLPSFSVVSAGKP